MVTSFLPIAEEMILKEVRLMSQISCRLKVKSYILPSAVTTSSSFTLLRITLSEASRMALSSAVRTWSISIADKTVCKITVF